MPRNPDCWIRVFLGAAILLFVPQTAWAWLGLLPVVTGVTGYCPLYHVFGWSTAPKPKAV